MALARGAQKGNQNSKKGRIWTDAIKRAVSRKFNGDLNHGLDQLAEKLIDAVAKGDQWAFREFGDRIEGKPAQSIEISGGLESKSSRELSEEELERIAAGGSAGAAEQAQSAALPTELH